ncbi:MAG: ferritin family protein [Deltaproteobacteria bacterium]|nr:ferritin family protein [Deltaproteobacteria bacterium]
MTLNAEQASAIAKHLFEAIKAESNGEQFYLMVAASTADEKGRAVFTQLADEERRHQQYLKAQYQALKETGQLDTSAKLGNRVDLTGPSPIFSDALKARAKDAHLEMSALSIGIQQELGAVKFYQAAAKAADEPAAKAFFEELAEWESGHYSALLRQQELLQGDYWSAAGFSPF